MVLKPALLRRLLVAAAALASCAAFASVPAEGWHPLAMLASLLPLQLAALFWALCLAPSTAAARHPPVLRPPASD
jgi:hypothetical protein